MKALLGCKHPPYLSCEWTLHICTCTCRHSPTHSDVPTSPWLHAECHPICQCLPPSPCRGTDGLAVFVASSTLRLYAPDSYLGNQQRSYGLNFTIRVLLLDGAVPATEFPVYLSGGALNLTLVGSAAVADSQTSPGPGGVETLLTLTVSPGDVVWEVWSLPDAPSCVQHLMH